MVILTVHSLTDGTLRVALLPVPGVGPGAVHPGGAPTLGYEGLLRSDQSQSLVKTGRERAELTQTQA